MKLVDLDKIVVGKRLWEGSYKADLHEMVASLRMFGQLVPLVVRRNPDGTYILLAGERQLLAAKKLGWKQIGVTEREDVDFAVRQHLARQELDKATVPQYQLHVGDCVEVMKRELSDASVDLIVTDPPSDRRELMGNFFREAFRVLRPGRHCYVFCGWEWIFYLRELAESCGFVCPGPPGVWVRDPEARKRPLDRLRLNYYQILLAAKPYSGTDKWQELNEPYDAAFYDITRVSSVRHHPAEAPVELFQRFIQLSSVKHEVVLDPFCGSGSCGVAAIYEKRRFIGIDIEPKWIQLTKLRIEEAIGGQQK